MLTSHEYLVLKEVHLKTPLAQLQLNLFFDITPLLLKPFVKRVCQQGKKLKPLSALPVCEHKPNM